MSIKQDIKKTKEKRLPTIFQLNESDFPEYIIIEQE